VCYVDVLFVFVLCLVCPVLPVSLNFPFLIAPSVFSNVCVNSRHKGIIIRCRPCRDHFIFHYSCHKTFTIPFYINDDVTFLLNLPYYYEK
jgi:hypothetical protein